MFMKVLFTNNHFGVEIMWTDRGYDQARGWLLILALYMGSNLGRCKTKIKKSDPNLKAPTHSYGSPWGSTPMHLEIPSLSTVAGHQPFTSVAVTLGKKKMWEAMNYCTYRARWKDTGSFENSACPNELVGRCPESPLSFKSKACSLEAPLGGHPLPAPHWFGGSLHFSSSIGPSEATKSFKTAVSDPIPLLFWAWYPWYP